MVVRPTNPPRLAGTISTTAPKRCISPYFQSARVSSHDVKSNGSKLQQPCERLFWVPLHLLLSLFDLLRCPRTFVCILKWMKTKHLNARLYSELFYYGLVSSLHTATHTHTLQSANTTGVPADRLNKLNVSRFVCAADTIISS